MARINDRKFDVIIDAQLSNRVVSVEDTDSCWIVEYENGVNIEYDYSRVEIIHHDEPLYNEGDRLEVGMLFRLSENGENRKALFVTDKEVVYMVHGELCVDYIVDIIPGADEKQRAREKALAVQLDQVCLIIMDKSIPPSVQALKLRERGLLRDVTND
jgi:hypothetical protein